MALISVEEYLEHIKPALMKVFKDCIFPLAGASSCPFQDTIESRSFLFAHGIQPFWDNPTFWNALLSAVLELGDTEIFVTDTIEEYCLKYILASEKPHPDSWDSGRAICSLQGNWGILYDIDGLGLIGGPTSFIDNIRKDYPEIDQQIYYYLNFIKPSNTNIEYFKEHGVWLGNSMDWLPEAIIHIYGEKKGKEILEYARKMDIYWD